MSLDDETYRHVLRIAVQRDMSVSALVEGFLQALALDEIERLKREERAMRERIVSFDASDPLSRDEVHERDR